MVEANGYRRLRMIRRWMRFQPPVKKSHVIAAERIRGFQAVSPSDILRQIMRVLDIAC